MATEIIKKSTNQLRMRNSRTLRMQKKLKFSDMLQFMFSKIYLFISENSNQSINMIRIRTWYSPQLVRKKTLNELEQEPYINILNLLNIKNIINYLYFKKERSSNFEHDDFGVKMRDDGNLKEKEEKSCAKKEEKERGGVGGSKDLELFEYERCIQIYGKKMPSFRSGLYQKPK